MNRQGSARLRGNWVLLVPTLLIAIGLAAWRVGPVIAPGQDRDSLEELKSIARDHLTQERGELAWDMLAGLLKPDAEAHWLLSRAALQRGALNQAEAALAQARSLGFSYDPMRIEPAAFVGSAACMKCHGGIGRDQRESHHAFTFSDFLELDTLLLPDSPIADPEAPGVLHHLRREGDDLIVETEADGERYQAVVSHLMGSGNNATTPVGIDPEGQVLELRLSYYANGVGWDLTTGHPEIPTVPSHALGRPLSEQEQQRCLECHTTHVQSDSVASIAPVVEGGVSCERCHGPGGNHLAAVDRGMSVLAITRPKLGTAEEVVNLCGDCHKSPERGPQPESSNPSVVRFQATTFVRSACYSRSPTTVKFDCVSCHDPHRNLETDPRHYEAVCLSCHSGSAAADDDAHHPPMIDLASQIVCPTDARQGCIDCHMPLRESSMRNTMFTDHHIRVQENLDETDGLGSVSE